MMVLIPYVTQKIPEVCETSGVFYMYRPFPYHGIGAVTYLVYHIFCTQTIFSRIKDDNFSDMFYNRHKYIKLLYPMM